MKVASAIALGLLLTSLAAGQAAAGWTTIFNGTSLNGWNAIGNANWKLGGGMVQADMGSGFLVSAASYGDFELKAELWVDDDANSGVFIRCSDAKEVTAANAYEVNIFDKRPDQAYRTGAIVDVAKPTSQINAAGKWNTLEITAQGQHLTVTLNGAKTADVQDKAHAQGFIALQYGAGVVKFRNVQIRRL